MNNIVKASLISVVVLIAFAGAGRSIWRYSIGSKAMTQNKLITHDMPEHGLALIGQSAPSFEADFKSLVRVSDDLQEAVKQFTVIVTNNGRRNISAVTVKWEFELPNGQKIPRTVSHSRMDHLFVSPSFFLLAPGGKYPVSLFPLSGANKEIKSTPEIIKQAQLLTDLLARSVRCNVTIDGVLFTDGTYVGVDSSDSFDRLQAEVNATRDLLKEARQIAEAGQSAAEVFKHIDKFAKLTREQLKADLKKPSDILSPIYCYNKSKANYAKGLMAMKEKKGGSQTMEFIRESNRPYTQLVKR